MKKSFMSNIKNFVDSNVRQRIDKTSCNINQFYDNDLLTVERQFDDLKNICVEAEKRISALLQSLSTSSLGAYTQNVQASLNSLSSNLSVSSSTATTQISTCEEFHPKQSIRSGVVRQQQNNGRPIRSNSNISDGTDLRNEIRQHKKLPIVGFLKFLVKTCHKSKPDSLLSTTLLHCSELQTTLTKLYLSYEQTIELHCLKPIQQILETDVPNVIKLKKLFIKSHYDLETVKAKYNGVSQKQLQLQQQQQTNHFSSTSYTITQTSLQQANVNKLEQLKKELDDAVTRFEQARDTYATELYTFVCREPELANLFVKFYQYQADYQQQVSAAIQSSLPPLTTKLAVTPRKVVFGTPLDEQLRCTGRSLSLVIELCVHLLYSNGLNEEGLFRIPGSSVKIKKLRSAINAWFVTLANQDELTVCNQHRPSNTQASVIAISNLFYDIVAQTQEQLPLYVGGGDTITSGNSNQSTPTPYQRDTLNTQLESPFQTRNNLVFDVHSIAGLLKLYLRELPEPLFTYALYDQLIEASVKNERIDTDLCTDLLIKVIEQLPKSNYDNVRHLIRFLHLLTSHCESNKMTAANLAITMAPSLIWIPDNAQQQQTTDHCLSSPDNHQQDDMQALSIQMSNIGIKASLHAFVIENLIKNAEKLFPGQVDFTLPELENTPLAARTDESNQFTLKQGRYLKSISPTGLSTASSSSFSSTSNASIDSNTGKTGAVNGGSVDGLLDSRDGAGIQRPVRPMSVNLKREQPCKQKPPPVPPIPVARSHLRYGSSIQSAPKPQALMDIATTSRLGTDFRQNDMKSNNSSPVSLRGTGYISATPSVNHQSSNPKATRPTVPPPSRPPKVTRVRDDGTLVARPEIQLDSKSSQSLTGSGNFKADFEEINQADFEELETSEPVSPIVSLDSISNDDDLDDDESSLDEDCSSIENSWIECKVDKEHEISGQPGEKPSTTCNLKPVHHLSISDRSCTIVEKRDNNNLETSLIPQTSQEVEGEKETVKTYDSELLSERPPVKPPRCISPKITQSTPL